jgi:hypothetical protein
MRGRPQLRVGRAEKLLMKGESFRVPSAKALLRVGTACGRIVMQGDGQHLAAPDVPIIPRIDEVLMPDLVNCFAWGHFRLRYGREKAEATVAADRRSRLGEAPAPVAGQPSGEIEGRVGLEIMLLDAPPQVSPGRRPCIALYRLDFWGPRLLCGPYERTRHGLLNSVCANKNTIAMGGGAGICHMGGAEDRLDSRFCDFGRGEAALASQAIITLR